MSKGQKDWTTEELRLLKSSAKLGVESCAILLGRSEQSIKQAAKRYRISLRQQGSRGGILLGQPRGTAWMNQIGMDPERLAAIRQEAIAGDVDIAELEQRIRDHLDGAIATCPSCARRPVERPATGLCEPCHMTLLARAHRDEADRRQARRDLDAARQEKARSNK